MFLSCFNGIHTDGGIGAAIVGVRRGGSIPNLAVGNNAPGDIFLNSNKEPKRMC